MNDQRRLAADALRRRPGSMGVGWLIGSILVHAGFALAMAAFPRGLPQQLPDRQIALVWTEQGQGAGDAMDSAGAGSAAEPSPAPTEAPEMVQAASEPAEPAAPEPPPPVHLEQAETQAPASEVAPDVPLPLPPPAAPRRPPAEARPVARQAVAPAQPLGAPTEPPPARAGGVEVTGAVRPPRQLGEGFNKPPAYPAASRIRNEQGRVTLQVEVSAMGEVTDAAVQVSTGFPALDRAALEAVRSWRFEPALRDGQPVHFVISIPFLFQLEGALRW